MSRTKPAIAKRLTSRVKDRRAEAERLVLSLLPENGLEKRWSEIEEAAQKLNLSTATLARALKKFVQLEVVTRRVDSSTYPPAVYYRLLTPEVFAKLYDRLPLDMREVRPWIVRIGKIKDSKLREEALGALLEAQACLLLAELTCVWGKGIASRGKPKAKAFNKVMVESFVAPTIDDLGLLCKAHSDVTPDLLNRLFEDCVERFNMANVRIVAVLRAASEREDG